MVQFCLLDSNHSAKACYPLPKGSLIGLRYIHSVAKTPVEEWFRLTDTGFVLEKAIYHDFGAGLPFAPEDGQVMRFEKGSVVLERMETFLPQFDVRVGRIAKHTLLLPRGDKNKEVPLDTFVAPGASITFTVQRVGQEGGDSIAPQN